MKTFPDFPKAVCFNRTALRFTVTSLNPSETRLNSNLFQTYLKLLNVLADWDFFKMPLDLFKTVKALESVFRLLKALSGLFKILKNV